MTQTNGPSDYNQTLNHLFMRLRVFCLSPLSIMSNNIFFYQVVRQKMLRDCRVCREFSSPSPGIGSVLDWFLRNELGEQQPAKSWVVELSGMQTVVTCVSVSLLFIFLTSKNLSIS